MLLNPECVFPFFNFGFRRLMSWQGGASAWSQQWGGQSQWGAKAAAAPSKAAAGKLARSCSTQWVYPPLPVIVLFHWQLKKHEREHSKI